MDSEVNIVIYFAHLDIDHSRINRAMCDAVRDLPHVNFRDLHELYPNFFINVMAEQAVLRQADLIVFQHPIYWYGAPAIFKHFLDTVFLSGFAYGAGGTALRDKDFLLALSTGAAAKEYQTNGIHHYPLEQLILPMEQTVRFCGMRFLSPLVIHSGQNLTQESIKDHAQMYRQRLENYKLHPH